MIVGIDQILLDLVVQVDDDPGIFERCGIERNSQCLAEDRHQPLLRDLTARAVDGRSDQASATSAPVRYVPGGLVCNALRAAAWSAKRQSGAAAVARRPALKMMGMVGRDKAGEALRKETAAAGVDPMFLVKPNGQNGAAADATGICACLVYGKERSMVTELRAGKTMELHGRHAPSWPSWDSRVAEAAAGAPAAGGPAMVVTSGFYAQADPEGVEAVRRWCAQPRKEREPQRLLALSVAAEWCCSIPAVQALSKHADFLFANEPEIFALAAALARAGEVPEAPGGDALAALRAVAGWKGRGWVVATRGAKSVVFVRAARAGPAPTPVSVPVPRLPPEEFVDDVGAGDSFMGGFLLHAWQRLAAVQAGQGARGAPSACMSFVARCCSPTSTERCGAEAEQGGAHALSEADLEAAAKAGIAAAAACLRCVGCQHAAAK